MGRLSEQMIELARNLVAETEKRREFVARNRLETQRLRERFGREREQVQREIERQAEEIESTLRISAQSIQREVARTLVNLKTRRTRIAADQRISRRHCVTRIRRGVMNNLQRQRVRREWSSRQHQLAVAHSLQRVRRRVSEIRAESLRFTTQFTAEMNAGRRALLAARGRIAGGSDGSFSPRL